MSQQLSWFPGTQGLQIPPPSTPAPATGSFIFPYGQSVGDTLSPRPDANGCPISYDFKIRLHTYMTSTKFMYVFTLSHYSRFMSNKSMYIHAHVQITSLFGPCDRIMFLLLISILAGVVSQPGSAIKIRSLMCQHKYVGLKLFHHWKLFHVFLMFQCWDNIIPVYSC